MSQLLIFSFFSSIFSKDMEPKAAMKLEELQQSLLLIIFGFPVLTGTS